MFLGVFIVVVVLFCFFLFHFFSLSMTIYIGTQKNPGVRRGLYSQLRLMRPPGNTPKPKDFVSRLLKVLTSRMEGTNNSFSFLELFFSCNPRQLFASSAFRLICYRKWGRCMFTKVDRLFRGLRAYYLGPSKTCEIFISFVCYTTGTWDSEHFTLRYTWLLIFVALFWFGLGRQVIEEY